MKPRPGMFPHNPYRSERKESRRARQGSSSNDHGHRDSISNEKSMGLRPCPLRYILCCAFVLCFLAAPFSSWVKAVETSSTKHNETDEFARQTQQQRVRTIHGCRAGDSWEWAYRLKLIQHAADFPMLLVFVYLIGYLQVPRPVSNKVLELQNFCRGNPGVEHLLHA